jgi:hypothetical protein
MSVLVMETHTAKIIGKSKSGSPIRIYRNHMITKVSNDYLRDPEIRGSQYNVYARGESPETSSAIEIVATLGEAKRFIDGQQDQCPHKYVSREGGGNWEWIYFATEEQAQDVIAWIRGAGNDKFSSGRAHYNGHTPVGTHCVHAHYDNQRSVPHQSVAA